MVGPLSINEIASIKNRTHRSFLPRDTSDSVPEIASQMNLALSTAYSIARKYLPAGYLRERNKLHTQSSKSEATEDDDLSFISSPPGGQQGFQR